MKILNIFCDASIKPDKFDPNNTLGCAGCICVDKNNIIDKKTTMLYSTTNNEAEISAVLNGVHCAYKYKDIYDIINIFSDSKICVFGLREWIFKWKLVDNVFYGSSNTPIINQHLFISVVRFIVDNNMNYINLYHQKGHVTNAQESILNASRVFTETNGCILDIDNIKYISLYNNIIDKETKDELLSVENIKNRKLIFPVRFNIDIEKIKTIYKDIIKADDDIHI